MVRDPVYGQVSEGVLRVRQRHAALAANVIAYVMLLRDEYPPFSWEPAIIP